MIRALLIDLFDTLVYLEEERYISWREEMARHMGIPPDEFLKIWWSHTSERFLGKIKDIPDMLHIAASHFKVELSDEKRDFLARKEREVFLSISHLYPGTREALSEMKKEGFLLALVSNASSNAFAMLEHLDLIPLFDVMVVSCDVGVAKPSEEIYKLALSKLDVSPEECLFIGDGACQELDGAHSAGIRTIRIIQMPQTSLFGKSLHYDYEIRSLRDAIQIAKTTGI